MDKIQLLVLEVVQRHRLPVQKNRLYIEVIEYLEYPSRRYSRPGPAHAGTTRRPKRYSALIPPEYHIARPAIEPGLVILVDLFDQRVRRVVIERCRIDDLFSRQFRLRKIQVVPGRHPDQHGLIALQIRQHPRQPRPERLIQTARDTNRLLRAVHIGRQRGIIEIIIQRHILDFQRNPCRRPVELCEISLQPVFLCTLLPEEDERLRWIVALHDTGKSLRNVPAAWN